MRTADAIVVGLGAMGSATAWQLARRGARVIGIDRFAPPHEHGASHGETRVTRHATGEGPAYVALALRSHEIWREIERETGEDLLLTCGGIVIVGAGAVHPKKPAFLDATVAIARDFAIAHEVLPASEIRARFPQFRLAGNESGYFEPGAGLLYPERCVAAQLDLARRAGATILTDERVLRVEPRGGTVLVETDRGSYEAPSAIVTAGGWNPELVPGLLPPTLHRQLVTWFETTRPDLYAPDRFPIFIRIHDASGETSYGFPLVPGSPGVKVAREEYRPGPDTPDAVERAVDPAEIEAVYRDCVEGQLEGVGPRCVRSTTCFYTQVPDNRFVIERHPDCAGLVLVAACSGHGFKHSAAVGETLAASVVSGVPRTELAPFGYA